MMSGQHGGGRSRLSARGLVGLIRAGGLAAALAVPAAAVAEPPRGEESARARRVEVRQRRDTRLRLAGTSTVVLDLNSATAAALERLPGIGPRRAVQIVERRQRRPFRSVDELRRLRGFGDKLVARLRGRVRVGPAPPAGDREPPAPDARNVAPFPATTPRRGR